MDQEINVGGTGKLKTSSHVHFDYYSRHVLLLIVLLCVLGQAVLLHHGINFSTKCGHSNRGLKLQDRLSQVSGSSGVFCEPFCRRWWCLREEADVSIIITIKPPHYGAAPSLRSFTFSSRSVGAIHVEDHKQQV